MQNGDGRTPPAEHEDGVVDACPPTPPSPGGIGDVLRDYYQADAMSVRPLSPWDQGSEWDDGEAFPLPPYEDWGGVWVQGHLPTE